MVEVSIVSLIYRSRAFADWVYESVNKYTPMLASGQAEFFFVANDPTDGVVQHLRNKEYPHCININKRYSDEELFSMGYGRPEYMSRVYRGYNEGILKAKGEIVVLVNSDNFFSPDWLENLLKYLNRNTVVSSKLIEPRHHTYGVFESAIHMEFGNSIASFNEREFIDYVDQKKMSGLTIGGAYMPCALYKDTALIAGLYPQGNLASQSFDKVDEYGDIKFFQRLASLGVQHITSLDSLVYHLKEGEKDDSCAPDITKVSVATTPSSLTEVRPYSEVVGLARIRPVIQPIPGHPQVIEALLGHGEEKLKDTTKRILGRCKQIVRNALVATHMLGPVKRILGRG